MLPGKRFLSTPHNVELSQSNATAQMIDERAKVDDDTKKNNSLASDLALKELKLVSHHLENVDATPKHGGNAAEDVEELLAQELTSMSVQERNEVLYDVHGVTNITNEDPPMVENALIQLDREIEKIKAKHAYEEAKKQNKLYVEQRKFRLKFLRAVNFDVPEAAKLMVAYFTNKLDLFGPDKIASDIKLSDFDGEDMQCLRSGVVQLLPISDQGGRCILFFATKLATNFPILSLLKVYYYILMSAAEDESHQKRGMVTVSYNVGWTKEPMSSSNILRGVRTRKAMPIRTAGVHLCYDNPLHKVMISVIKLFIGKNARTRFRDHYGPPEVCLPGLNPYGIPNTILPVNSQGEFCLDEHHQWLENRRRFEEASMEQISAVAMTVESGGGVNRIEVPRFNDVLFGRGKTITCHPGNMRLHKMVEYYQNTYQESKKLDKSAIAQVVVDLVQKSGGRFLKQDKFTMTWAVVPDNEACEKVLRTFRNQRAAAAMAGHE